MSDCNTMPQRAPNILFILSDQHRWSALGCYGNEQVVSPSFDRLAAEGTRFTNCLSSCPVCAPFRATMQTGLHAHQHGVRANQTPWLGQHFRGLADYFNEAGYETCFIGKAHWGRYLFYDTPWIGGYVPPSRRLRWKHWYTMHGHDQYDSRIYDDHGAVIRDFEDQYQPTVQTDLAMEKIREFGETPWFVQLNWGPPHTVAGKVARSGRELVDICRRVNREYGFHFDESMFDDDDPERKLKLLLPQHLIYDPIMPATYLDRYDVDTLDVEPNVPERFRKLVSYHLKEYYGMITSLDDELARLMTFLAETGRDRDTLVVYTSDHGDRIGAHCSLLKFRTKSTWHQNSCRVPLIVWGPGVGVACGVVNDTPIGSTDFMPTFLKIAGLPVDPHLPGESFADCFTGDCATRDRDLLLSLDPWRAIFDGRYLYAINGLDDSWEPISLIDTQNDRYDLNNLLDDPAHGGIRERLHVALVAELIRTCDHEFLLRTHLKERHL